jgi:hypothetical protein
MGNPTIAAGRPAGENGDVRAAASGPDLGDGGHRTAPDAAPAPPMFARVITAATAPLNAMARLGERTLLPLADPDRRR